MHGVLLPSDFRPQPEAGRVEFLSLRRGNARPAHTEEASVHIGWSGWDPGVQGLGKPVPGGGAEPTIAGGWDESDREEDV